MPWRPRTSDAPGSAWAHAVSQVLADRHRRAGASGAHGGRPRGIPVRCPAPRAARGAQRPSGRAQHPAQQRPQDGRGPHLAARGLERDLRGEGRGESCAGRRPPSMPASWPMAGSCCTGAISLARGDAAADHWLAESLIPHMRLSHEAMPYLRWSYFRSGQDDLMTIFPFVEGQSFSGEVREASVDQILARFADVPIFDRDRTRIRAALLDPGLLRPCRNGLDGRPRRAGPGGRALGRRGRHRGGARLPEQLHARLRLSRRPALAAKRGWPGLGRVGWPEPGGPAPARDVRRPARQPACARSPRLS